MSDEQRVAGVWPRYARYKESGVEWIGQIPSHWEVVRHLGLFDERREVNQPDMKLLSVTIERGVIPQSRISTKKDISNDDKSRYKVVRVGDLAYNKMRMWQGAVGMSDYDGIVSPAYVILEPKNKAYSKFFHYLFRTQQFIIEADRHSYGLADDMNSLRYEHFKTIYSPVPPQEEAERIVGFLDEKVGEIDTAVAQKQRLIDLLQEQKEIMINTAVTRGLNPHVPLKESGIPWLGRVPAHWEVKRLGYLARVVRGASPRPAGDPKYFSSDNGFPWVTVAEVTKNDNVYLKETKEYLTQAGVEQSQVFLRGTVVFTNSGATLGVPKILAIDCCANDGIVAFRNLSPTVNSEYLYFYLSNQTVKLREEIKQGSGQPNLNTNIVKNIVIPLPNVSEQLDILYFIHGFLKQANLVTMKLHEQIRKLNEYKQVLIAAAVTGQLKL